MKKVLLITLLALLGLVATGSMLVADPGGDIRPSSDTESADPGGDIRPSSQTKG